MKNNKNPYHFNNQYCLRAPLLSLNTITTVFENDKIDNEFLKSQWENPLLKEAIFLASPYLYEELSKWYNGKISDVTKIERLKQTFLKYIIRASTRCTPFGLFAGIGIGSFSEDSRILLDASSNYNRHTRLDMNSIVTLINFLEKNKSIKNQLLFFPNSTLYPIANQYRYIEYQLEKTKRTYSIEAVEHTPYLETILKASKKGETINQLATKILDNDISIDEARQFVGSLIDNQILVSELELNVTGNDYLNTLIKRLGLFKNTKQIISSLKVLQHDLRLIDKKTGNTSIPYHNCFTSIKKLGIPYEEKYVFQTDLFIKSNTNTLGTVHGYTIKRIIPLLNKLTPLRPNKKLEQFKKAFLERYETREMPLAKVLDIELGIGYIQHQAILDTTPFLEYILPQNTVNTEETIVWNEVDSIIYEKLVNAKKNKKYTITLTDKDFEQIELDWNHIPDTLAAFVEVLKINNRECLFVHGLSANSGKLLARFSYGNSELLKHLKEITHLEQKLQPKKILAEIVHLPKSRTGNILKRLHLRTYEIPYLAKSTLPLAQQISINDLLISVRNNKIMLRSKKLNKEVLPRLTNAHNYEPKALPIYHFLCDLQSQDKKEYLGFSWPELAEKHSFLPRVIYKGTILSKAKWYLRHKNIKVLMTYYNNKKVLISSIQKWRKELQVPKYVQLVENDNTLLIDLEHFDSIQLLLTSIKNKKQCVLEEFLFTEDTIVNRKNERFTNECVITLYNEEKLNQIHL